MLGSGLPCPFFHPENTLLPPPPLLSWAECRAQMLSSPSQGVCSCVCFRCCYKLRIFFPIQRKQRHQHHPLVLTSLHCSLDFLRMYLLTQTFGCELWVVLPVLVQNMILCDMTKRSTFQMKCKIKSPHLFKKNFTLCQVELCHISQVAIAPLNKDCLFLQIKK